MFDKAFRLAIDLNDHDLFMDIHHYALAVGDDEMAIAAQEKAEQILSRSNSCKSSRKKYHIGFIDMFLSLFNDNCRLVVFSRILFGLFRLE